MTEQQRLEHFAQELTTISRKHGIAVISIGGVFFLDGTKAAEHIAYTCDAALGDLKFKFGQPDGGIPFGQTKDGKEITLPVI